MSLTARAALLFACISFTAFADGITSLRPADFKKLKLGQWESSSVSVAPGERSMTTVETFCVDQAWLSKVKLPSSMRCTETETTHTSSKIASTSDCTDAFGTRTVTDRSAEYKSPQRFVAGQKLTLAVGRNTTTITTDFTAHWVGSRCKP